MIEVFLGFDSRETIAFQVASHSIQKYSSRPVSITPLMLAQLEGIFSRPRDPRQSTDFSFTRFLVPYLCNYSGWAIFADCDILVLDDIVKLWELRDERYAVQVVKHQHIPVESHKFLGHVQTVYDKKNWSSLMLFNNALCRALTLDYVHQASGLALHQFHWLQDDSLIGSLPHRWNHLVDYDLQLPINEVSLLHFTQGGPWFEQYKDCGYSDVWRQELHEMLAPLQGGRDEMIEMGERTMVNALAELPA
ncbi:MAG TPA: glycosyltransferase [Blastocatellia bacterium]|nr:glycosyltransferase [Blastocatellia bacterium]